MKLKASLAAAALAAAPLVCVASGSRADLTYVVAANFDDGTTLTGGFTVNVYGYLELASLDLTTTAGTVSAYNYTGATVDPDGCGTNCLGLGRTVPEPYFGGLQLTFQKPLGSSGFDPIIGGEGGPSWENQSYAIGGPPIRYISSGVATVPEPSTWAMMLAGFAALGFGAYRRARASGSFA